MTKDLATVRSRLWRNGQLEAKNFPFEQTSEYLQEEGCLVWVDICEPESADLVALANELSLDRWPSRIWYSCDASCCPCVR